MAEKQINNIVFVDSEVNYETKKIIDLGAFTSLHKSFHSPVIKDFIEFVDDYEFVCGHNILNHDLKYLNLENKKFIDTLFLSPLLFPKSPYHKLLKDDKICKDDLNNPVNDAKKAMTLFFDEINAFRELPKPIQDLYASLLSKKYEFQCFFDFLDYHIDEQINGNIIKNIFAEKICNNVDLDLIIDENPIELAYALAIIQVNNEEGDKSITPFWVLRQYPKVEIIIKKLCNIPCEEGCLYCNNKLNIHKQLKRFFNYSEFRTYEGEPLQERACSAAVQSKSLIAIFPTGGGKSLTFQLPALIAGETVRALTVVISPLQSLMKDQIDNLEKKNIVDAVTINGLLNPIERAEAINRIQKGIATILYLSPEQLRSKTIEHILLSRNVDRFVIDEAHCFSAWGQDFRVDYLYIGDFIKKYQEIKCGNRINVSCFTATAKPKVIMDIKDYFKKKLNLDLEIYASDATRENLIYSVCYKDSSEQKYNEIRTLIESRNCSTIVYVDSVQKTREIAERLTKDGYPALPYNGKMESKEKVETQEKFINDEIKIIVATSAFGMGVDKPDIKLIIHYNVPSSLEDYMQESGRGAREQSINAECYILFSPSDIDRQFIRLNQSKLTMNEIQQVWSAIKRMTKKRDRLCRSALEIAREAGWNNAEIDKSSLETKVKTALLALEKSGYIMRKQNMPRVYATSINAKNVIEAQQKIISSGLFDEEKQALASAVISKLIASRTRSKASNDDAESRIDWLADSLGVDNREVLKVVNLMKQIKLLADNNDMGVTISEAPQMKLKIYESIEDHLLSSEIENDKNIFSLKVLNENIQNRGIECKIKYLRTIFSYWKMKSFVDKSKYVLDEKMDINLLKSIDEIRASFVKRMNLSKFILDYLMNKSISNNKYISFSVIELLNAYKNRSQLSLFEEEISQTDIEDSLFWLHKTNIVALEGGFLVLHNKFEIIKLVSDNKIKYKKEDYKFLDDYYKQKIQQIHIVGELLNILVKNYKQALTFIKDYFKLDYKEFIDKYFKGRDKEIQINMTPSRYKKLFGELSETQKEIITDDKSRYIVVAAGPGSGKTKVLVHKLASLLTLEDVKSEQLLMLTFSRAAALEFKKRLWELIGSSASYVEIKTFHSYCFDILGRPGSLENSDSIISDAVKLINNNEVESARLAKVVLVIDEAQDMSEDEFSLVEALINYNETMRVIAVGDDDQNIYEFRGSNSKYLQEMISKYNATKYEMTRNYRSSEKIVHFANDFARTIKNRIKQTEGMTLKTGGNVCLTRYTNSNIELPMIQAIIDEKLNGSTCILTKTNEEALKVLGVLNEKKIPAKLIQSLDGFNLMSLQEIRFIMWYLNQKNNPFQISDRLWNSIKYHLKRLFQTSHCLPIILELLDAFEKVNPAKYFSDLESFLSEAKFEDFYETEKDVITISTIHKSKGHEFDNVYMLMKNNSSFVDENKRTIFVGMTRAKNNLSIHYNDIIFDDFYNKPYIKAKTDKEFYSVPNSIILQLTHKDVFLSYFKYSQKIIQKLRSGDSLKLENGGLSIMLEGCDIQILKFSSACKERIQSFFDQGYELVEAKIRFIVYWENKDDETEYAIVLPDIKFRKNQC